MFFQTVGRMIVPDITFRDRTCFVFCFLGCVVKFQAREANSWPRSASSNPGNRVCVLFVFLSFSFPSYFEQFFSFSFTFIKLAKPVRHHASCFKKIHINNLASSNKQGRCEERRKSLKETERSSPLHSICGIRINV